MEQVACEKWGACGAADAALLQRPESAAASGEEQQAVRTVHKKIRLSDEYLAWEHEIFSVKRAPFQAVTFSARAVADLRARGSLLDRGCVFGAYLMHTYTVYSIGKLRTY